jgi:hypothetical protein
VCARVIGLSAVCALAAWLAVPAAAQVVGDDAEMDRLQAKADEAIANEDADGASMQVGRAALMASQLAKRQKNDASAQWYRGAEALFRAEEHAYRAQALFVRAGGELPASSGVCGSLALARQHIAKAVTLLMDAVPADGNQTDRARRLHDAASEWVKTIAALSADFRCS